ncbi:MAG TPA: alpha/beta fold hydrolase [Opitutaceae bacterium]|jgi:triacylglycerol lipase
MHVVMTHGFLNSGRLFGPLRRRLEASGHRCLAPTLHPRDGRSGIPDLASKLAALIASEVPAEAPLALIGFSMGALISRYYLQLLGGTRRTRAFLSVAGPYRGSLNAYLYPGTGTREMRPGSALLAQLEATAGELAPLRVVTYRTPFDLMVVPSSGSRIAGARNVTIWCPLHSLLPIDPRLIADADRELARLDPRAKSRSSPTWESAI